MKKKEGRRKKKDEQTMFRSELDPFAHNIQELAHRQVAGHKVLGLVKVGHRRFSAKSYKCTRTTCGEEEEDSNRRKEQKEQKKSVPKKKKKSQPHL